MDIQTTPSKESNEQEKSSQTLSGLKKRPHTNVIKITLLIICALFFIGTGIALERFILRPSSKIASQEPTIISLKKTNLCDLLTPDQIGKILGYAMKASSITGGYAVDVDQAQSLGPCIYTPTNQQDPTKVAGLTFYALKFSDESRAQEYYSKQISAISDPMNLDNVGQGGAINPATKQLITRQGSVVLTLSSGANSPIDTTKLEEIGQSLSISAASIQ